jgi:hypothetical protein
LGETDDPVGKERDDTKTSISNGIFSMTSTPPVNPDQATQTTLLAIQALFHDPDQQAKRRANEWLSEFQHTVSQKIPIAF